MRSFFSALLLLFVFIAGAAHASEPAPGSWRFVQTVAQSGDLYVQVVKEQAGTYVQIKNAKTGTVARMSVDQAVSVSEAFGRSREVEDELKKRAQRDRRNAPEISINAQGVEVLFIYIQSRRAADSGTRIHIGTHNDDASIQLQINEAIELKDALAKAKEIAAGIDEKIKP